MTMLYTVEQILALASDATSAKSGKGLASARKWLSLGHTDRSAWGECQGSGVEPYQTQIDLSEPAFKCTCPSHKFPCKHALGLFILLAEQTAVFTQTTPPTWVSEWLTHRAERVQRQIKHTDQPAKTIRDVAAQEKRASAREQKIAAGLEDLVEWLHDLIHNGLANVQTQPLSVWETRAARLVDAQAPGLARWLGELSMLPASGTGWQERMLERLSQLHLLIEAYHHLEALPLATQIDVRTQIGWTYSQDDLLAQPRVRDHWFVLAQRTTEDNRLRTQRIWLWGKNSQRAALILNFAYGQQPFTDIHLLPATSLDASLVFYPSAYPLRAMLQERHSETTAIENLPGHETLDSAITAYAEAVARQPWLEQFPLTVHHILPIYDQDRCLACDREDKVVPIAATFTKSWQLLALSGGRPISLFGEWNGRELLPLSSWAEDRFVPLSR